MSETAAVPIQDEIVVVATPVFQLLVFQVDSRPDGCGCREVERSAGNRSDDASRNQGGINRGKVRCVDREHVLEHVAPAVARQVEVRVLRQVDRCSVVCSGKVVDSQLVAGRERVADANGQVARIPLIAVGTRVGEDHGNAAIALEHLSMPHDLVESAHPPMQMVRPVVGGEVIRFACKRELPVRNTVGVTPDDGTEVG